ncbi:MAG: hypothetical protein IKF14_14715 [Atopobiaceae bacterium]|nr:hypothetical protein [Atopobiaceae bacterium]
MRSANRAGAPPPAWMRKLEIAVLMRTFSRAFGVEAPSLRGLTAAESLHVFREFTAACMELALERPPLATIFRHRLSEEARRLGTLVRQSLRVTPSRAFSAAAFFYRGIDIELEGTLPGELRFVRCSFAQRYTPADCWLMSAFDEGFMRGVSGMPDAELSFSCRLTQGAPCCQAHFMMS